MAGIDKDEMNALVKIMVESTMKDMAENFRKGLEEYLADPWAHAEEHRRYISDMDWAKQQPEGPPNFSLGDIVEFKVGGFGRITDVKNPNNGWPSSYATRNIKDMAPHASNKSAWHYEGDISQLIESASEEVRDVIAQLNGDHQKSLLAHMERDRDNA